MTRLGARHGSDASPRLGMLTSFLCSAFWNRSSKIARDIIDAAIGKRSYQLADGLSVWQAVKNGIGKSQYTMRIDGISRLDRIPMCVETRKSNVICKKKGR